MVDPKQVKAQLNGLQPEEIQEWINIGIEFLAEIVSQRGLTAEQLRARRKQIFADEAATIDAELATLPPKTAA